jgi:hypothetical protein
VQQQLSFFGEAAADVQLRGPNSLANSSILFGSFHDWLQSQGKTKATIKETINYAKKYAPVLDIGDASPLLTLSPRNCAHAQSALANLAKFKGVYPDWLQVRQRYGLKWSKGDSIQSFERFFNDELNYDTMLQRIRQMIRLTPLPG